jgi:hypothetical protein
MNLKENARCDKIARTGRVESWLNDADGRLPVSCTVFVVEDSMEGDSGIEDSWRFVSHGLRNGAGVAIHLSNLRGKGDENGKGLVASGPVSFGKIYSTLNEILRRGGKYKNGAVVLHLDYTHPDALDFVKASRKELPWTKRCLNVDDNFLKDSSPELIDALLQGISSGDVWLNKIRYDDNGNRLRANVCLEVYLPHRGTCLLQHVNMGACSPDELSDAFVRGMEQLCELHPSTGVGDTGEYLSPAIDKQASCSYRYLDKKGFTTTPEIAPPIARAVDRDSGTFGVESFDYGNVEIAEEVGWDNYSRAVNGLVSLYQETGLFHGYSFNSWSDVVVYDRAFLQNWLDSSQTSLYYSLQVLSDTQRKDDAYAALDDSFKSMFGLDDSEVIEETVACDIEAAFCAVCAE